MQSQTPKTQMLKPKFNLPSKSNPNSNPKILCQRLSCSSREFSVDHLGQLDKLRSPIQPKWLTTLTAQLTKVTTRATTYVQYAAARRESRGKSTIQ